MSSDGGKVEIVFASKQQAELWNAIARTTSELAGLQGQGEQMATTTAKASASLRRFAEAVKEAQSTPDSRLAAELAKIEAAVKATLLTEEEAAVARTAAEQRKQAELAKTAAEMGKAAAEAERLRKAEKSEEVLAYLRQQIGLVREKRSELAQGRSEMESAIAQEQRDVERLDAEWERYAASVREAIQTPIQSYHAKLEKLSEAHVRGKLTLEQYHTAAKKAFDDYKRGATSAEQSQEKLSVGAVTGGTLLAHAYMKAGQVMSDVFRRAAEELDQLKEKSRDAGDQYGELAQLQANTPELVAQVNQLVASGSVKSFAEGKAAVFAAESAGAQSSMPSLAELAKFGVIQQMPEVIRSAEALRFTLGEQAGTPEEILAKSFASARSATTTAERVTIAASKSGTSGRELGISANESLAAAGILASAKGNADTAGERLAALFRGLKTQEGMQGKSLPQMLQDVQRMNMSFADRQKFLGGSEADEAFSVLQAKLPQLAKTIEAVADARGAETLRVIAKDAAATPETALTANARAAQAQADLAGRQLGNVGLAVEASFNEKVTAIRDAARMEEFVRGRRAARGEDVAPAGSSLARAELEVAMVRTFEWLSKWIPGMQQHLAETAEASRETTRLMREAARANLGAAGALERAAGRRDSLAAPRREAAAAHGGG